MHRSLSLLLATAALSLAAPAFAQQRVDERPETLNKSQQGWNYERREVEVPMRDGVKLHTVILIPKGAKGAPILLTRTPYNANSMTGGGDASGNLAQVLQSSDGPADVILDGGYIRVIQDVRGKYGSQGIYMMNPPLHGTDLNPTKTDDATDSYDTIDWLVKNIPQSNGKVGVLGISYDGYLSLMPLIDPHPALAVAVPMNPMVDGWRGDDWFHNGALRQTNITYMWEQEATRSNDSSWFTNYYDDYDQYMNAGSAGALADSHNLDQIGFWHKITEHPAYDAFWQDQAMDKILARQPLKVPVMLVHGLWDQEDIYGAPAVYSALEPKDTGNDTLFITMGPWHHGQEIRDGNALGAIKWDADTAKQWRMTVLGPFLAHFLKGTPMDVAPVTVFQSGANQWQHLKRWPTAQAKTKLFLKPDGGLGFTAVDGAAQTADYVSDPAHPVTYRQRPILSTYSGGSTWSNWLADDQRQFSTRPDVLTFTTDVLTAPVKIAGQPVVHLNASTSGTDSDWVVKLIDVYPDQVPTDPGMGGYQFAVGMDIFRGRYRESLAEAKPVQADTALDYSFDLPNTDHVFLPGHRIMVQIQSSWFPLYDRNPQTFVPNIIFAKPGDYQKATQKVTVGGANASYIALPLVK